jgi:uncharacterized protein YggE
MRTALLTGALASAALATVAAAQPPTAPPPPAASMTGPTLPPPSIVVTGRGEERVTPDRARVTLGVQTQAPTAAAAATQNARRQRAVLDTLRALGIPAEQITTSDYNVFPEQQYDEQTRRARIVGYNVQNNVIVELRRIDQVGAVLDATLAKGANNVSSLSFFYSDAQTAQRRALGKAVEAARAEAEVIAAAAGGRLGEVIEISSVPQVEGPRPMFAAEMRVKADASAPTPISEGTQTVTGVVAARWRFTSGR